jgi:niacin transporter
MHWAVILAGLVYGWRGGAISGLLAPLVSFMITSMPPAPVLPAITAELIAYGFIAGLLREKMRVNPFMAVFAALVIGRILFMVFAIASGTAGTSTIAGSLLPGLAAATAQIIILPFVAKWWVKKESGV